VASLDVRGELPRVALLLRLGAVGLSVYSICRAEARSRRSRSPRRSRSWYKTRGGSSTAVSSPGHCSTTSCPLQPQTSTTPTASSHQAARGSTTGLRKDDQAMNPSLIIADSRALPGLTVPSATVPTKRGDYPDHCPDTSPRQLRLLESAPGAPKTARHLRPPSGVTSSAAPLSNVYCYPIRYGRLCP